MRRSFLLRGNEPQDVVPWHLALSNQSVYLCIFPSVLMGGAVMEAVVGHSFSGIMLGELACSTGACLVICCI